MRHSQACCANELVLEQGWYDEKEPHRHFVACRNLTTCAFFKIIELQPIVCTQSCISVAGDRMLVGCAELNKCGMEYTMELSIRHTRFMGSCSSQMDRSGYMGHHD